MTTPLAELFSILHQSQQANQQAMDRVGRVNYPTLCTVSNNNDPTNQRRIRVADPSRPGLESDWLLRLQPFPYLDPPLPAIGQTVICLFEDGKESSGWYLTCVNQTNPALAKESPQNDWWCEIPGHRTEKIGGKRDTTIAETDTTEVGSDRSTTVKGRDDERVDLHQEVSVGLSLTLKNDAGASLTLTAAGAVVLADAYGNRMVLGGATGSVPGVTTDFAWQTNSNAVLNLGGNSFAITNANNVTIAGKSVTTIGALDTASEALVTRGW